MNSKILVLPMLVLSGVFLISGGLYAQGRASSEQEKAMQRINESMKKGRRSSYEKFEIKTLGPGETMSYSFTASEKKTIGFHILGKPGQEMNIVGLTKRTGLKISAGDPKRWTANAVGGGLPNLKPENGRITGTIENREEFSIQFELYMK